MNYDTVFHVDLNDPQRLNICFDNVTNYFVYLAGVPGGKEASVVVLAYGPAVNLFVDSTENAALAERAADLMKKGASIRLCSNALRKFKIDHSKLWKGCEVVPAGVPELVRLHNEGYTYIKP